MSCKAAKFDPDEGRYYCDVSGDQCIYYIPKIKDGSKLSIGKGHFITVIKVDQHFNWLQKKMWKFLLGIKVEDYTE